MATSWERHGTVRSQRDHHMSRCRRKLFRIQNAQHVHQKIMYPDHSQNRIVYRCSKAHHIKSASPHFLSEQSKKDDRTDKIDRANTQRLLRK